MRFHAAVRRPRETLHEAEVDGHSDAFEILGVPCNQFMQQDPGDNDEIQSFCLRSYDVSFPILGKTDVNGDKAEPVYEWMKASIPGLLGMKRIKWNFEKSLIGKDGPAKERWACTTKPESFEKPILEALKAGDAKSEL